MSLTWIASGLATVFLLIYLFFQHKYTYWMSKNVFFLSPVFPFGNFKGVQRQRSLGQIVRNIYSSNKSQPAVGVWIFAKPALIINNLELIRTILIKEFNSFMDRGVLQADKYDPLTGHLFLLRGKKWRKIRTKLTPTFTSGKMKMMSPTLLKCGDDFKDHLKKAAEREEVLEMKNVLSSFTLDVIASCAFGLEINAFKNPDSEFKRMSDFFFNPDWIQSVKNFFAILFPKLLQVLKWKTVPEKVTKFFIGVVQDTFDHREKNEIERNDFVQLLLELKKKGRIDDPDVEESKDGENFDSAFTIEQAAAQAFVFFIAGFETSSSTMMFCLFELARNQDIQDRLREEMDKIIDKHNGKITYEGLQEMEYMDQVISETLRLYPPAPILVRECTKHCYIPQLNAVIEKGTRLFIPVLGIHHDPDYYPDPEKFDPDRFSTENKKTRDPMCHLPFGDGPRICIGMRFAQMQSKAGLTILLTNYKVELSEKTEIPLRFDPKVIFTSVIGGIHLKLRKR